MNCIGNAGTRLTLVSSESGVTLKAAENKTGGNLGDLIGMLQHNGPPVSLEQLCKPVDYSNNRQEWIKESR